MIWQTYHKPEDRQRCFTEEPYAPFDLLSLGLPPAEQTQLCEYAAMRHLHRNQHLDTDGWIGFTSVNQHTKVRFGSKLRMAGIAGEVWSWGWRRFRTGKGDGVAMCLASEMAHPGITALMQEALRQVHQAELPEEYITQDEGPFSNYWLTTRGLFNCWMEWSLPLCEFLLRNIRCRFLRDWPRGIGFIMERLFVVWTIGAGVDVVPMNEDWPLWVEVQVRNGRKYFLERGKVWLGA